MNRTAVLPNFGGTGIPTLSNCQPYAFDDIYNIQQGNDAGFWSISYPTFQHYMEVTGGQKSSVSAQLAIIFSRDAFKQIHHLPDVDEDILHESCIDTDPYDLKGPTLFISTEKQEPLERVVAALQDAQDKDVIFVYFNHKAAFVSPQIEDHLLQARPQWGLWSRAPFPYWNYSGSVMEVYEYAKRQIPEDFVAIQWRLERVPPPVNLSHTIIRYKLKLIFIPINKVLSTCSDLFLEAVISGARERDIDIVYIAADAPIRPGEAFKSASWDSAFQEGVIAAMSKLIKGLDEAGLDVVTWNDLRPRDESRKKLTALGENASGIFDRLMVGRAATWMYAPNINCGMKSAYLGSIQTMRQDRIGDTTETDWNRLGMLVVIIVQ